MWTLWGMGLSVAGALMAITLAWLGQSPKFLRRIGLSGARLDLRVRAFTGYALALLLLAIAFFLAGVPLGARPASQTVVEQQPTLAVAPVETTGAAADSSDSDSSPAPDDLDPTPATPETGAFSGPPAANDDADSSSSPGPATGNVTQVVTPSVAAASPTIVDTRPRPTETATPAPTETPLPTLTPTVIVGQTGLVNTNGSTLWLKRSPGGQNLVLVRDDDLVIIRPGRANQGGLLWRQVATVAGVEGWLQEEFVLLSESPSES